MLLNKKNNYLKEFLYIVEKIKNTNILIHIIYLLIYGDGLENNTQKNILIVVVASFSEEIK